MGGGGYPPFSRNFSREGVFYGKQTIPKNMKTNVLPIKAFLAALGAILFIPVSAAAAVAAFTFTGVFALLAADYGRTLEPLRVPARVIPFRAPSCQSVEECSAA